MSFNLPKIVYRNLAFYRWTSAGLFFAAALSGAVLVGSLVVGDSVDGSLGRMLDARLGETEIVLTGGDRFFRTELASGLSERLSTVSAAVFALSGMAEDGDGRGIVNDVAVWGVDERFFEIGRARSDIDLPPDRVHLNSVLAGRLGVRSGDEIVLRVLKPGMMPRDIPLTPDSELTAAFRLQVGEILDAGDFGWFGLHADQRAPLNAFLPRNRLAELLGREDRANVVLLGGGQARPDIRSADTALEELWRIEDAGLELRELDTGMIELHSRRVFIDHPPGEAAMAADENPLGVLTYFVNSINSNERSTPYSIVTAISPAHEPGYSAVGPDLGEDEIIINEWLADDLAAGPGDEVELVYYTFGHDRRLSEESRRFVVRDVVPIAGPAADAGLMPAFPGLADADSCRDWAPGIPIDLDRIRERDEQYWEIHRGTPKAFVTLAAGESMWSNPYGRLTAVRYRPGASADRLAREIRNRLSPRDFGLQISDVRAEGVRAREQAMGFGQLFLGFNMFLIAAALVLLGLVFAFAVESRTSQIGMMKAVGYTNNAVGRVLLMEGAVLAAAGICLGALLGLGYTKWMIWWLSRVFGEAGRSMLISFSLSWISVAAGAFAALLLAAALIWFSVRRWMKRSAGELLNDAARWQFFAKDVRSGRTGLLLALIFFVAAAAVLTVSARKSAGFEAAGAFFAAGALLLSAGLSFCHYLLVRTRGKGTRPMTTLSGFGMRNATRRSGRTLAAIAMLAAGVFVVIAVGANRRDEAAQPRRMDSGAGGFSLIGTAAISIPYDLNTPRGRAAAGLPAEEPGWKTIVPFRVLEGDDASCFNLNRAQRPRLLGVDVTALEGRFSFTDRLRDPENNSGWRLLEEDFGERVVPAVGDSATVRWALGKALGDEIEYADRRGRPFPVVLAGIIGNSAMQGSLIISDENFREKFAADGYRMFLVEAEQQDIDAVRRRLSSALRDFGLELVPAEQRLAEFAAVENSYIAMFRILGGFGLLVGSLGLGLVAIRNILDRRGELAMLQAVGYGKKDLRRMLFYEHAAITAAGLVCGAVSALVAVWPQLAAPDVEVPYLSLSLTVAAIAAGGLLWVWLAVTLSLHGDFYEALRHE